MNLVILKKWRIAIYGTLVFYQIAVIIMASIIEYPKLANNYVKVIADTVLIIIFTLLMY